MAERAGWLERVGWWGRADVVESEQCYDVTANDTMSFALGDGAGFGSSRKEGIFFLEFGVRSMHTALGRTGRGSMGILCQHSRLALVGILKYTATTNRQTTLHSLASPADVRLLLHPRQRTASRCQQTDIQAADSIVLSACKTS